MVRIYHSLGIFTAIFV